MNTDGRILVVAYGAGVDSTAAIIGLKQRGIRPDKILFADVGAEKAETYAYLAIFNQYLEFIGFPTVTVVRYVPKKFKHWPPYYTLEENCLTNGTLPSIAFGFNSCSQKWKHAPQHKYLQQWQPAIDCWARGEKVLKIIGYDDSTRDQKRSATSERLMCTFKSVDSKWYEHWYPLQEWHWDREECKRQIAAEGLPVPSKSSCFFCTAMKPDEVAALPEDKLRRIVLLEARAKPRLRSTAGLWRKPNKKQGHTGSMTEFIERQQLLPVEEIKRIQQVPEQLVAFQQAFAEGRDAVPLGAYLQREFPSMYPEAPQGSEVVEVEFAPGELAAI